MTTGRAGYGAPLAVDPLEARLAALESAVATLSRITRRYDVREFPTVANAFASVPAGATLFFPKGTYAAPDAAGWVRTSPIIIDGEGRESVLVPYDAGGATGSKNSTVLTFGSSAVAAFNNIAIRNIAIVAAATPTVNDGTGDGIRFVQPLSGNYSTVDIENVTLSGMGRYGLHFDPTSASSLDLLSLRGVRVYLCRNRGVYMAYTAAPNFSGCYINGNQGDGVFLDTGCGAARFRACYWENNWAAASGADATYSAQVRAKLSHAIGFFGCSLENWNSAGGGTALTAMVLENCAGAVVDGCHFTNANLVTNTRAINAISGTTVTVGNNLYQKVDIAVDTSTADSTALVGSSGIISYDGTSGRVRVLAANIDHTTATSRPHGRVELFGKEVNLTGQTASIGSTTLITGNAFTAGVVRVTAILSITVTAAAPTIQGTLAWTSPSGAKTLAFPSAALAFAALADSPDLKTIEIVMTASTNLSYSTTLVGAIGTGVYAVTIRPEAL